MLQFLRTVQAKGEGVKPSPANSGCETALDPKALPCHPSITTSFWTLSDKSVLQTAQAIVFNPDSPSKTRRIRHWQPEIFQCKGSVDCYQGTAHLTFEAAQKGDCVCSMLELVSGQETVRDAFLCSKDVGAVDIYLISMLAAG